MIAADRRFAARSPLATRRILAGAILALASVVFAHGRAGVEAHELYVFPGDYGTRLPGAADCVGKPATPVCAMLTFHVCVQFNLSNLCNLVGVHGIVDRPGARATDQSNLVEVLFARPIPSKVGKEMPSLWRFAPGKRPAQVEIGIVSQWCATAAPCPEEGVSEVSIFLAREKGLWKVVGWTDAVGYAQCEFYPEPYGRHCNIYIEEDDYLSYVRAYPINVDYQSSRLLSQREKDAAHELGSSIWLPKFYEEEPAGGPPEKAAR